MRGTVFLTLLFIVCFQCAFGQATGKINYTISNGLQIAGVDQTNPVIYDNDMVLDTPEMFYLWLKANRKEVNLVGNINTRDLYLPPNIVNSHDLTFNEWTEAYNKANQIGLKNIPQPIKGSDDWLRKPASGVIEQTQRKDSPGSDLIISEARKASASKPLVIFVGGQVTSIANAYLKDNSIADKIIVLHVDGWDETMYNGVDYWATEIVMRRMLYINWAGSFVNNRVTWYAPFRPLQVNLNMPANPWTDLLKNNYYGQSYSQWKDVGDGPVVFWFFDHSVWKNAVRRTADKQTTTSNTYDYLLISDNDWPKYGAMLSGYMNDPKNYIPVTTTPPANVPPTVSLTIGNSYPVGNVTLSANASDSDGTISKVEFFNGTTKIGEDLSTPYSLTWAQNTAGTFSITAKATDNNNGQTTSAAVNVSITSPNTPPVVSITSPANGSNHTAGSTIAIAASASDANGAVAKVEFFSGTTKLGEDLTSPYSYSWVGVPAGTHSITAKATDNENAVTTSNAISIIVNAPANTLPAVSITSPANNAGFVAGASVTISANATDANGSITKVEFFNGATKLGEDATSPYSFVWPTVPAGTYSLTAKATDNQNAVTTSTAISITVTTPANTLPAVSITSPANNAGFVAGASVTISANATDANGSITKVEFFNGATKLGEDATSPYSFVWPTVPAGTYSLTAKATDNQNAVTTSTAISITVTTPANTLPAVSITSPANNAGFVAGASVTISANATDANGSITKVEFFNGATKLGEDVTSPYSFVWPTVPAGTYSLTAKATDNQNAVTTSTAISITVTTPANTLPAVSITSPANNAGFVAGASVTISANATDANGSITKVEFFNGATKLGEDVTSPYSFLWPTVPAGTYSLTAKATDNQNAVTTSTAISITVTTPANTLPAVSITSPANNAGFVAGASVTISANATDANGSITKVEFFNGATKLGEDVTSPYSFLWPNVPAGTYSLTAKATDNQNAVTTSTAISITVTTPVNTLPAVSITSPANNAGFVAGASVTISANATDANGSITKVEFFNGATKLGEDVTSPYSFLWPNVPAGTYSLTAKATDNQNAVTTSTAISITVTTPVNTLPAVSITSPANNAGFVAGASVTISANATDANGSITKVEFFNGATKLGEDVTSPFSFLWSNVAAGGYSLTAKATDNQNGVSTSAVIFISVTGAVGVPPTVALTSPANNATSPVGTPVTLTATATASGGNIVKVEFFNGTAKLGEDTTAPYSFTWNSPPVGTHALGAKATDSNSLVTTSALNQLTIFTPNVLPVVSITSPTNNAIFPLNASITITASASDTDGSISKVEFFNGTAKLGEDLTSPYSFIWTSVPNGNYSISAKATDSNSAVGSSGSVNVSVSGSTTAPTISITSPANHATFDETAAVTFDVVASTAIGTITKVEFFDGTNKLGEDLTSPYSFTWNNIPAGEFTIIAKAIDNQNVASTAQVSIIVNALNSPPEANAGDDITTSLPISSLKLVGSAIDIDGNISHREWKQVSGPVAASLIQTTVGELHLTDLEEGTYVFTFTVRDDKNLESTDDVIVKVIPELASLEKFPRYFTPNNDGVNDYWEWPQLELYANSQLVILNRFGQPVFQTSSYQNNWNGTMDGNPLQEDAYYFIIKLNNADIKGAVRIVR